MKVKELLEILKNVDGEKEVIIEKKATFHVDGFDQIKTKDAKDRLNKFIISI